MRLQFSIIGILLFTTYAAMFSAAVADISSRWTGILILSVPLAMIVACFVAIFARRGKQAFAVGFLVGCALYFGYAVFSLFTGFPTPHDQLMRWLPYPPMPDEYGDDFDSWDVGVFFQQSLFAGSQCLLVCGVIFGVLARFQCGVLHGKCPTNSPKRRIAD